MSARPADVDQDIRTFLSEAFGHNYELLRIESGRALSPEGKQFALNQVLLYWRKLRDVALSVTDTEVHLMLPNQRTAKGRPYAIEGIVDIVRAEGYTVMYDIKSHDADFVRQNKALYEEQLNVYAYIWQTLREEQLNQTAIIATDFPPRLAEALESGDEGYLAYLLAQWNPIVELDFDTSRVQETVIEFGRVVDAIEDHQFAPRSVESLDTRQGATEKRFATAVCRNCDARFSCDSYRAWALGSTSRVAHAVRDYFSDVANDEGLEAWRTANLAADHDAEDLMADFGR